MALSTFCSNSVSSLQQLNSEMLSYSTSFHHQEQVLPQQLDETPCGFNNSNSCCCCCCFELADNFIDPCLAPADDDLFYTDSYTNLLPHFSSPSDSLISLSPEIFPLHDFESKSYQFIPKRQKISHHDSNFASNFFSGCYLPNPQLVPEFFPEMPGPVTQFQAAPVTTTSETECAKKPNGTSLSMQSIAARERRRKITEKTQELGKLIPGGHRMNTAEMFQAASKYVKFLQAQFKLLQLMEPKQEMKEPSHTQELQNLLASPKIREKLYSEEKCLVPKEFVENLANDPELQSKPLLIEGIDHLLSTNGQS